MKKLWQKIKTLFKRFRKAVETTSVEVATTPTVLHIEPTTASLGTMKHDVLDKVYLRVNGKVLLNTEVEVVGPPTNPTVPVPVPTPPKPPSKVDYEPYRGMTKDEIEYKVKHRYLPPLPEGWDWEEAFAAGVLRTYGTSGPSVPSRDGGTHITTRGHPYVNTIPGGVPFTYTMDTVKDEPVELFITEHPGTPDTMVQVQVYQTQTGQVLVDWRPYYKNGRIQLSSPGGSLTIVLLAEETGPRGVQRN